nr:protein MAIN-LIKE 1-like [Arachis hypogaea]XP_025635136.1 protein MAIN-LIKE 1-like [Arachis hypogaea]XP_025663927.1 protein MAIN-LIKE 1-like [Arachis hypogaea]
MVRNFTLPEEHIIEYLDHPQWAIRNLLPRKLDPPDTFNERAAEALALTGFQHVSRIGEMRGHSALLSALVERWRPETHTFHLPVGEVTVTLEDVIHILGLQVNGEPVTGRSDSSYQFLVDNCLACFGRQPGPDDHVLGKVNLHWVRRCRDSEPCDSFVCVRYNFTVIIHSYICNTFHNLTFFTLLIPKKSHNYGMHE